MIRSSYGLLGLAVLLCLSTTASAQVKLYMQPTTAGQPTWDSGSCDDSAPCVFSGTLQLVPDTDYVILLSTGIYNVNGFFQPTSGSTITFRPLDSPGVTSATVDRLSLTATGSNVGASWTMTNLTFTGISILSAASTNGFSSVVFQRCNVPPELSLFYSAPGTLDLKDTNWNATSTTWAGNTVRILNSILTSSTSGPFLTWSSATSQDALLMTMTSVEFSNYSAVAAPFPPGAQYASVTYNLIGTSLALVTSDAPIFGNLSQTIVSLASSSYIGCSATTANGLCSLTFNGDLSLTMTTASNMYAVYVNASTPSSSLSFSQAGLTNCAIDSVSNAVPPSFYSTSVVSSSTSINIYGGVAHIDASFFSEHYGVQSTAPQLNLLGVMTVTSKNAGAVATFTVHRLGLGAGVTILGQIVLRRSNEPTPVTGLLQGMQVSTLYPLTLLPATTFDVVVDAGASEAQWWSIQPPFLINNVAIANLSRIQLDRLTAIDQSITVTSSNSYLFYDITPTIGISWPADVAFSPDNATSYLLIKASFTPPILQQDVALSKTGYYFETFSQTTQTGGNLFFKNSNAPSPNAPVAPVPAPVPPLTFPPSPTPSVPIGNGCGPEPTPLGLFNCSNGVWSYNTSLGSVAAPVLSISTPIVIDGNFSVPSIQFNGLNASIQVTGCAAFPSQVLVTLTPQEYIALKANHTQYADLIKSQCAVPSGSNINIQVNAPSKRSCDKIKANLISNGQTMTGVFRLDSSKCNTWWIILVSVLGGVFIIVIVLVLIFALVPAARECIRPYSRSRIRQASPKDV